MTDYVVKPLDANTWDAFSRLVEDVRALQRHTVPLRAGRLQLPPPQRQEELCNAQGCALRVRELLVAGAPKLQDLEYEAN